MSYPANSVLTRRQFGQSAAAVAAAAACQPLATAQDSSPPGVVSGEPTAAKTGLQVLQRGGTAIDAAVAAAFVAAVCVPHQTGMGGYGGHMTIALAQNREQRTHSEPSAPRITCIDFNSHAPAAARGDMFPLDAAGRVVGQKNMFGWLAAGVPGILAGLEMACKKYGTRPLGELMQPAIALADEGFPLASAAAPLKGAAARLAADPGSLQLYFRDGQPLGAKDIFTNRDLARMLRSLAVNNSVESFYRGDIARQIAAAFSAGGGLVTKDDLAAYRAREAPPLTIAWKDWRIATAPLTAGGATALHALRLLDELGWSERDPAAAETAMLQIEAFRYAWQDRLELFGDPEHVGVPLDRLLERSSLQAAARQIESAVAKKQPLPVRVTSRPDQGTIHLSAADRAGNFVAVTLTHGGAFGARVTVPGLGLTLGHGMSRFDPHPGHPNAPGPHKRPLNNMCPTIVSRRGLPTFAVGGRGGRKIPNAVGQVLLEIVACGKGLAEAVGAPRMHTEGGLAVACERAWPAEQTAALKQLGYNVSTAPSATVSAVSRDESGELHAAMR